MGTFLKLQRIILVQHPQPDWAVRDEAARPSAEFRLVTFGHHQSLCRDEAWTFAVSNIAERSALSDDPADWLLSIAERGDRGSFISLFSAFAPKVKGYLLRNGASEQIAEELTQDTFLTIWRKARQYDPMRATPSAWIYTIARNLWVDLLRRERRPSSGLIDEQPEGQLTPEQNVGATDAGAHLRVAVGSLPREQAEVMRLSYFEDRTHHEIADQLGLPLGTVKSRIRLASATLKSTLTLSV